MSRKKSKKQLGLPGGGEGVRKHGISWAIPPFAACPTYSCERLDKFLAQVPEARATLEKLKK
jgi:hypothetical protein